MKLLRSARWMVLAILLSMIPASSHAGVFISVGIAPPPLPVYEQPLCPEAGWIWTPGYWAYDYDYGGYYWVPGTWVPAPYIGALWTPGYWGWGSDLYIWHPGYWGRHVGYYGGVNYGFGYFGIGFAGGEWRGNRFAYNTAVWRVNRNVIRDVYEDRRVVDRYTIRNDRRVAYSGGPGGIRHDPTGDERNYMREDHMQPTNFQQQHQEAAVRDRSAFYNNNHGRPATVVAERPMTPRGGDARPNGMNNGGGNPQNQNNNRNANGNADRPNNQGPQNAPGTSGTRPNYGNSGSQNQPQNQPQVQRPQNNNPGAQNNNRAPESNMRNRAPERQSPNQIRPQPAPKPQQAPQQMRQAPPQQMRQQPQQQPQIVRPMPQARPQPEARPAPQQRQQESRPAPQQQRIDRGNDSGRGR